MMEDWFYSALDLAAVLLGLELGCRAQAVFLERVWKNEQDFLQEDYRNDKRALLRDTAYWLHYFCDKPAMDAEFPVVQRDARALGRKLEEREFVAEPSGCNLFFKNARLRILYGGKNYVKVKRRVLLTKYGYRRMSAGLLVYLEECVRFYRLRTYTRNYVPCGLGLTGVNDIIIFRVSG